MKYFIWFAKLQFSIFKNSYFKDVNTMKKTLSLMVLLIVGQVALTRILYTTMFSTISFSNEIVSGLLFVFFLIAVIWVYLITFAQSVNLFIQKFYKSPDMSYLITIPIPFNYVFMFKFIQHFVSSSKSMLFLIFPFLAALGLWANASLGYYFAIIPIYLIVSIIPSVLGVITALISLKFIPIKIFNSIIPLLTFVINVSFAVLFTRAQDIFATYFYKVVEFFETPWLSDLLAPVAGVKLFYSSIVNQWSWSTVLMLLLSTFVFVQITFILSRKLYFEGWLKNQILDSKNNITKKIKSNSTHSFNGNPIVVWIKTEWKMAIRNKEMLMGSLFMFLFFIFAIFSLIYSEIFLQTPIVGLSLLIMIASMTNVMAISILFIPAEVKNDKSLWRKRYWLLKIMPLDEHRMFTIQCSMFFIPGFIISLVGISVYSAMSGVSIQQLLLTTVLMCIILYGSSAIYVCGELVSLTKFFEKYAFFGNLATFILPILYGVFSSGVFTLYLAKDIFSQITIFPNLFSLLNLPFVILVSLLTIVLTYIISRHVFIKVWRELEI